MDVPSHPIDLLNNLHDNQEATVRIEYEATKLFTMGKEWYSFIVSPCLIKLYAQYMLD